MIKDIVVNLSPGKPKDVAGDFAISLASAFEAHLSAVAFAYQPPVAGGMFDGVVPSVVDTWMAERQSEAEDAIARVVEAARREGVALDTRILDAGVADAAVTFSTIARSYDLSVIGQAPPEDDLPESLAIESTLFESGRPVLVVPYIQRGGLKLDRVMVCWDGSRNAARAVADAMPLLHRAKKVDVLTIERKERLDELRGAQIAEHLARHKLNVELRPVVAPDTDAASMILSQAADSAIDLIVMGGYGHSRFREFVLGGATRDILAAMTVPVLLSH